MRRRPSRRAILKLAGLAAASMALPHMVHAAGGSAKPNIIVILVDDLGFGDLSSYGAPDLKSPHIDALAAAGMRFDNFYANGPVCSPTRAALLTGRYPDLVGVPGVIRTNVKDNWGYLSQNAVLLPQLLKPAGYHTAVIGKWHLGLRKENHPIRRGFDHFHGFLGDMMDDYYHHKRHGNHYMQRNLEDVHPQGHATDIFTRWAVDYIAVRAKTGKPFFLYLAYNAPHTPIQPPKEWLERVNGREAGIDDKRAKLVALIEHLDDGIGRVLVAIRDAGIADNTLIIFTSDNGGQLGVGARNGPLRGGKGGMYEGGLRVPACAVWPGRIEAGSRSARVAMTMDLFPTVCDAAGVETKIQLDGRSILPTLLGRSQARNDRTLIWVRREGGRRYAGRAFYAVRRGDYKLVQNSPFEPMQLFNLAEDPKEEQPLPSKHEMYGPLSKALQAHLQRSGAVPWQK